MLILDANILIYAYFEDAPQHVPVRGWLEQILAGPEIVGLSWIAIWSFVRLGTNPRIWPNPPGLEAVFEQVRDWLDEPKMVLVQPGPRHLPLLKKAMLEGNTRGTRCTDAALAALAIEHAATLASTNRDFRRFSGLRWINPLD